MKRFFQSKAGIISLCAFTLLMACVLNSLARKRAAREGAGQPPMQHGGTKTAGNTAPANTQQPRTAARMAGEVAKDGSAEREPLPPAPQVNPSQVNQRAAAAQGAAPAKSLQAENLSFLDQSRSLAGQSRVERDRLGRFVTRRRTAQPTTTGAAAPAEAEQAARPAVRLRLQGGTARSPEEMPVSRSKAPTSSENLDTQEAAAHAAARFCPYGRPIRCELVFTVDSTMEETPLVGLVMEPVYNNGQLIIPAGAELHGVARPDRLRDRIFSAPDWVLLLPAEDGLPNGRELRVRGLALDRAEPRADGLTWGITDGSSGLRGDVIRTLESEEVKTFAAGFISAAAMGLQEREGTGRGGTRTANSPGNAALQGLSSTLGDIAARIADEVKRHGVFLRVPGGKQFYFYPQQAIRPAEAKVPGLATTAPATKTMPAAAPGIQGDLP